MHAQENRSAGISDPVVSDNPPPISKSWASLFRSQTQLESPAPVVSSKVAPNEPTATELAEKLLREAQKSRVDRLTGKIKCKSCGRLFTSYRFLSQHLQDKHSGVNSDDYKLQLVRTISSAVSRPASRSTPTLAHFLTPKPQLRDKSKPASQSTSKQSIALRLSDKSQQRAHLLGHKLRIPAGPGKLKRGITRTTPKKPTRTKRLVLQARANSKVLACKTAFEQAKAAFVSILIEASKVVNELKAATDTAADGQRHPVQILQLASNKALQHLQHARTLVTSQQKMFETRLQEQAVLLGRTVPPSFPDWGELAKQLQEADNLLLMLAPTSETPHNATPTTDSVTASVSTCVDSFWGPAAQTAVAASADGDTDLLVGVRSLGSVSEGAPAPAKATVAGPTQAGQCTEGVPATALGATESGPKPFTTTAPVVSASCYEESSSGTSEYESDDGGELRGWSNSLAAWATQARVPAATKRAVSKQAAPSAMAPPSAGPPLSAPPATASHPAALPPSAAPPMAAPAAPQPGCNAPAAEPPATATVAASRDMGMASGVTPQDSSFPATATAGTAREAPSTSSPSRSLYQPALTLGGLDGSSSDEDDGTGPPNALLSWAKQTGLAQTLAMAAASARAAPAPSASQHPTVPAAITRPAGAGSSAAALTSPQSSNTAAGLSSTAGGSAAARPGAELWASAAKTAALPILREDSVGSGSHDSTSLQGKAPAFSWPYVAPGLSFTSAEQMSPPLDKQHILQSFSSDGPARTAGLGQWPATERLTGNDADAGQWQAAGSWGAAAARAVPAVPSSEEDEEQADALLSWANTTGYLQSLAAASAATWQDSLGSPSLGAASLSAHTWSSVPTPPSGRRSSSETAGALPSRQSLPTLAATPPHSPPATWTLGTSPTDGSGAALMAAQARSAAAMGARTGGSPSPPAPPAMATSMGLPASGSAGRAPPPKPGSSPAAAAAEAQAWALARQKAELVSLLSGLQAASANTPERSVDETGEPLRYTRSAIEPMRQSTWEGMRLKQKQLHRGLSAPAWFGNVDEEQRQQELIQLLQSIAQAHAQQGPQTQQAQQAQHARPEPENTAVGVPVSELSWDVAHGLRLSQDQPPNPALHNLPYLGELLHAAQLAAPHLGGDHVPSSPQLSSTGNSMDAAAAAAAVVQQLIESAAGTAHGMQLPNNRMRQQSVPPGVDSWGQAAAQAFQAGMHEQPSHTPSDAGSRSWLRQTTSWAPQYGANPPPLPTTQAYQTEPVLRHAPQSSPSVLQTWPELAQAALRGYAQGSSRSTAAPHLAGGHLSPLPSMANSNNRAQHSMGQLPPRPPKGVHGQPPDSPRYQQPQLNQQFSLPESSAAAFHRRAMSASQVLPVPGAQLPRSGYGQMSSQMMPGRQLPDWQAAGRGALASELDMPQQTAALRGLLTTSSLPAHMGDPSMNVRWPAARQPPPPALRQQPTIPSLAAGRRMHPQDAGLESWEAAAMMAAAMAAQQQQQQPAGVMPKGHGLVATAAPEGGAQELHCAVCGVSCNSALSLQQHLSSRRHLQRAAQSVTAAIDAAAQELEALQGGSAAPGPSTSGAMAVRAYCTQAITPELNALATDILQKLCMFQERAIAKNPVKGAARKLYVCGLREVRRAVRLKRARSVVLAPNIEEVEVEGGLSETVQALLDACQEAEVPVVFALSRKKLGAIYGFRKRMSAVAVLEISGVREQHDSLLMMAAACREAWAQGQASGLASMPEVDDEGERGEAEEDDAP